MLPVIVAASLLLGARDPAPPAPVPDGAICHTDAKDDDTAPAKAILTGYGSGGFKVDTKSPEAQAYFDNGMQLAHAFAHKAAIGAFKRAVQLDPTCAMCLWGEAWSRGPTINYPIDKKTQAELAVLADRAAKLGAGGTAKARAYLAALQKRYRQGGGEGAGDEAFGQAMDAMAKVWPDDNEIAVIAADALIIPDVGPDKKSTPARDRADELLRGALARNPDDTGAIHFYIHVSEFRNHGVDALPYALKLQALAPSASHLVHMPSHTYFWAGRYRLAEQSNLDAVEIDKANALRLKPKDGVFGLSYHGHNVQFGEGAALEDGDGKGGLTLAAAQLTSLNLITADDPYGQIAAGTSYFVYGRYGSKAEVEALPDPGARLPYVQAMWRYARAEAAARRGDRATLKREAALVTVSPKALSALGGLKNGAGAMVEVARLVLAGRTAMLENRYGDAATAYRAAADIQESRLGGISDPPAWWYPVRRSLAAALLADGKPQAAAVEAEAALTRWPFDPVSLRITADVARQNGDPAKAERQLGYARANWTGDLSAMPLAMM
jgi:tetratricopeptide (TPR) repeat protein